MLDYRYGICTRIRHGQVTIIPSPGDNLAEKERLGLSQVNRDTALGSSSLIYSSLNDASSLSNSLSSLDEKYPRRQTVTRDPAAVDKSADGSQVFKPAPSAPFRAFIPPLQSALYPSFRALFKNMSSSTRTRTQRKHTLFSGIS